MKVSHRRAPPTFIDEAVKKISNKTRKPDSQDTNLKQENIPGIIIIVIIILIIIIIIIINHIISIIIIILLLLLSSILAIIVIGNLAIIRMTVAMMKLLTFIKSFINKVDKVVLKTTF